MCVPTSGRGRGGGALPHTTPNPHAKRDQNGQTPRTGPVCLHGPSLPVRLRTPSAHRYIYIFLTGSTRTHIYIYIPADKEAMRPPPRSCPPVVKRSRACRRPEAPQPPGPPSGPCVYEFCVSCSSYSLVYSDLTKTPRIFVFYVPGLPPHPATRCTAIFWGPSFCSLLFPPSEGCDPFSFPEISFLPRWWFSLPLLSLSAPCP